MVPSTLQQARSTAGRVNTCTWNLKIHTWPRVSQKCMLYSYVLLWRQLKLDELQRSQTPRTQLTTADWWANEKMPRVISIQHPKIAAMHLTMAAGCSADIIAAKLTNYLQHVTLDAVERWDSAKKMLFHLPSRRRATLHVSTWFMIISVSLIMFHASDVEVQAFMTARINLFTLR